MSLGSPAVSVLIPCFNAAAWVEQAIASVRAQSFQNLEIIVYDDGSTDGSSAILHRLAAQDRRIVLIEPGRNTGIVAALNALVSASRGEYLARMDADDIATSERIERQLAFLRARRLDLCGTWIREFGLGLPRTTRLPVDESAVNAHLLFQNAFCHPTVLGRREVFEAFRYRSEYEYAEDYDVFARASVQFRFGNCPEPLLNYRRTRTTITLAKGGCMQAVSDRVRSELLAARGIQASPSEVKAHNRIRAVASYDSLAVLDAIEEWLLKLCALHHDDAQSVVTIASQWARACIRAAVHGVDVWRRYRASPLRRLYDPRLGEGVDLGVMTLLRLRREGQLFQCLRRLGFSA